MQLWKWVAAVFVFLLRRFLVDYAKHFNTVMIMSAATFTTSPAHWRIATKWNSLNQHDNSAVFRINKQCEISLSCLQAIKHANCAALGRFSLQISPLSSSSICFIVSDIPVFCRPLTPLYQTPLLPTWQGLVHVTENLLISDVLQSVCSNNWCLTMHLN